MTSRPAGNALAPPRPIVVLLWCLAGALAVSALFLPWSRRGAGSRLPGHELADLLLRQPDRSTSQLAAALALYALGAVGSLLAMTAGFGGRWPVRLRATLVLLVAVVEIVAVGRLHRPPSRWGLGADAAVGVVVVGMGALLVGRRGRSATLG